MDRSRDKDKAVRLATEIDLQRIICLREGILAKDGFDRRELFGLANDLSSMRTWFIEHLSVEL